MAGNIGETIVSSNWKTRLQGVKLIRGKENKRETELLEKEKKTVYEDQLPSRAEKKWAR